MTIKGIKNNLTMFEMKNFLFLIMICCICAGCSSTPPPNNNPSDDGIKMVYEYKSKCEQSAKRVKSDYAKDTEQYNKAYTLYINAKTGFDGWIGELKYNATKGGDITPSGKYKETLTKATEQAEAFVKYVETLYEPSVKSLTITGIVMVLPSLVDAGINISKEYRSAQKERREEIKKELDNLRLRDFLDI